MALLQKYKDLMIKLQDIESATNNFTSKSIGGGGYGPVYEGKLLGRDMVACKCLDKESIQGEPEFWKEVTTLSDYKHENLVTLLGFCYPEKILVYEYAFNGSLDHHLSSANLTWRQRFKICLQAARVLDYLHNPLPGGHERVIHCDIKSSNILLDNKWNAKLSDFGLSKMGPANQEKSYLITAAVGTLGYCDPLYLTTGSLTKESDVYSFGVVLFEVLLGTLGYEIVNDNIRPRVDTWKESYKQKTLIDMVFRDVTAQIDPAAFETYSDIAHRCLETFREDRPTMTEVVTELDRALKLQEISEGKEEIVDYEEMTRSAEPPLKYRDKADLKILVYKGVLLNGGKTWLSLTKNGGHCEMISIAACLTTKFESHRWSSYHNSKFAVGSFTSYDGKFKARVRTQFLTPFITYSVNLVFQFSDKSLNTKCKIVKGLKYKLQGETNKTSVVYHLDSREDGWLMLELYHFTCDRSIVNLEILFGGYDDAFYNIQVEGIEFRPMEIIEPKVSEEGNKDVQTITDSDAISWEEKLPADYQDIIKWSKDSVQWTTKKELYSILRNGFLVNDGQEWFSLDTNGMKCLMLSARAALETWNFSKWLSLPDSRFGEALQLSSEGIHIVSEIKTQLLSSQTKYAAYLVYKLPQDQSTFVAPVEVNDKNSGSDDFEEAKSWYINLVSPQTPVIRPKAGDENTTHNPLSRPKLKRLPKQRSNGWVQVQVWDFQVGTTTDAIPMSLKFNFSGYKYFSGLIVQGIEFRPI